MPKSNSVPHQTLKLALSGAAAGIATGLFGGGGGMVLVPLLLGWCKLDAKTAFASSVAIILPLCLVSLGVYAWNGALPFQASLPYLLGGILGGWLGGLWFKRLSPTLLKKVLAGLLIYGGIRCLFF